MRCRIFIKRVKRGSAIEGRGKNGKGQGILVEAIFPAAPCVWRAHYDPDADTDADADTDTVCLAGRPKRVEGARLRRKARDLVLLRLRQMRLLLCMLLACVTRLSGHASANFSARIPFMCMF